MNADPREGDFVWSHNEEDFSFQSLEDVVDQLECDAEDEVGRVVYYGERVKYPASRFMPDASDVLETAGERAYDEGGEHAEDFGRDASDEAVAELDAYLKAWADKNLRVDFYGVVNVKEYRLTAEDVRSHD